MKRAPAVRFLLVCVVVVALGMAPRLSAAAAVARGAINLTLTWDDSSDNELGFVIERAPSPKGPWRQVGNVGRNETAFLDANLRARTAYYYRVFAFSEDGISGFSNVALVTTPAAASAPWVKRQPRNGAAVVGSDTVFSVGAAGTPPLAYQWRCNGTNLNGATGSDLSLESVQPGHAGYYSVVVSNAQGATVSYPARLTVTCPLMAEVSGGGVLAPNLNGQNLELGRRYAIRAYPARGNTFQGWVTNGTAGPSYPILSFFMETNLTLRAQFIDVARPTITLLSPAPNARVTNAVQALKGVASDNRAVAGVRYQINGGEWRTATGTTNWLGEVDLNPGRNALRAYCVDATGNRSLTNLQYLTRVVNTPLVVQTNGLGLVSPNHNGRLLEIGQTYRMTAIPAPGFVLTNWSFGTNAAEVILARTASVQFQMHSNLVLQANFVDVRRPTVTITNTLPGARVVTATMNLRGLAADNHQIASVNYQLNGGPWLPAEGTKVWTAPVELTPGNNLFRVCSVDATGNPSFTNNLNITLVVNSPLVVLTNGQGLVTPNYDGRLLEIGKTYSMTAVPGKGFVFTNWGIATNSTGVLLIRKPAVSFQMQSNLVLQASFLDVQRPTLTITNLLPRGRIPTPTATLRGLAADNDRVAAVMYQLNQDPWLPADGTNRWTATFELAAGTNVVRMFCVDGAGNRSLTNTMTSTVEIDLPAEGGQPVGMAQMLVETQSLAIAPPILSGLELTGGVVNLWFWSASGVVYSLEYVDSLNLTNWTGLPETLVGDGTLSRLSDFHPSPAGRFYRLRVNLQP